MACALVSDAVSSTCSTAVPCPHAHGHARAYLLNSCTFFSLGMGSLSRLRTPLSATESRAHRGPVTGRPSASRSKLLIALTYLESLQLLRVHTEPPPAFHPLSAATHVCPPPLPPLPALLAILVLLLFAQLAVSLSSCHLR